MVRGIIFDKDGTLFHFRDSFASLVRDIFLDVSEGDAARAAALGRRVGFELETGDFAADSIIIAGTPHEIAADLLPGMPGWTLDGIVARINATSGTAPQVEAVPLVPLLAGLIARGLRLGVATNDAEGPARAHLAASGIQGAFDFVAGYDSGHGAKPDPGMFEAFRARTRLPAGEIVVVGDSLHDLTAGRAAGMRTVAVLTGIAEADTLAPLADAVLPDIGALPGWLDSLG